MTPDQDNLNFLPLRVTRVGVGGKRSFHPEDKRKLVEVCLHKGVSLSSLALKAGVNANQLHKWVQARRQSEPSNIRGGAHEASAFVPVLALGEPTATPLTEAATYERRATVLACVSSPPRLLAQLPNGVRIELDCMAQDTVLLKAMIDALRAN